MRKLIVFTDLDETLLERHTYSFEKARPALALLEEKGTPLIIVSSKTKGEIEHYRRLLGNSHPFIAENGGGIFIPKGYFDKYAGYEASPEDGYVVITLGTHYSQLRKSLIEIREKGFNARGFGDMTRGEISELTGLSAEEVALAVNRHFDEPFTCKGCNIEQLRKAINAKGLNLTEGRLYHLIGDNDKGKAVDILKELYGLNFGDVTTCALGDSPTDISMLLRVERPVAVQKDNGSYDERLKMPNLIRARGIGPEGWNAAIIEIVNSLAD